MLQTVDTGLLCLAGYELGVSAKAVEQLCNMARPLRRCRGLHLNAPPYGCGVAESLRSEALLLQDLGIEARWKIIAGDDAFFTVTKAIRNGLQGADRALSATEKETYLADSTPNARQLDDESEAPKRAGLVGGRAATSGGTDGPRQPVLKLAIVNRRPTRHRL